MHCYKKPKPDFNVARGVSRALALNRKSSIGNLKYRLSFIIPEKINAPIKATQNIMFDFKTDKSDLVIDFKEKQSNIHLISIGGERVKYSFIKGHIIIDKSLLSTKGNKIKIEFIAGESALNRNQDYLYTLFVPDRASSAFPCFDQPDMKAEYSLSLTVPNNWEAVANGSLKEIKMSQEIKVYKFTETRPLSTYLFAFVCGRFDRVTRQYKGTSISFYHRETDHALVKENLDQLFKLVFDSLDWMENYTGIKYPFAKYDFIAIPSFQYGGMEHTGATLYRASRLFLKKAATIDQRLYRVSLIAHETAHMWFGDLVTMKWFDDVWLKEVFANFMADKMDKSGFPAINHKLRFLFAHYPAAYSVDRSLGANPIAQNLNNMKDAGTLYGNIIYHKAPIVMKNLEQTIGLKKFQIGLRIYLEKYAYSNANYMDLVNILEKEFGKSLKDWCKIWVDQPDMPMIENRLLLDKEERIKSFKLIQKDLRGKGRKWIQDLKVVFYYPQVNKVFNVAMDKEKITVDGANGLKKPQAILLNGAGRGYAYFKMDDFSKVFFLKESIKVKDDLERGAIWIDLWENMLNNNLSAADFFRVALKSLKKENNKLIIARILSYLKTDFWLFLSKEMRDNYRLSLEDELWKLFEDAADQGLKTEYFNTYLDVFTTPNGIIRVAEILKRKIKLNNYLLAPQDYTKMAFALTLRSDKGKELCKEQISSILNPDRKKRALFIFRSLQDKEEERDEFFNSLKLKKNRRVEPWVNTALRYLNHPLKAANSIKYIYPGLELLKDIQTTGDIFFPANWTSALLSGHNSAQAANQVKKFLKTNPKYPKNLKQKILQSADLLLRSSGLKNYKKGIKSSCLPLGNRMSPYFCFFIFFLDMKNFFM